MIKNKHGDLFDVPPDYEDDPELSDEQAQLLFTSDGEEDDASMDVGVDTDSPGDLIMSIIDVLQTLGVEPDVANRYACPVIHQSRNDPSFVEMSGTGNIVKMAKNMRNLNMHGLEAFDMRTCKPSGEPWDVRKRSDRQLAYRYVRDKKPLWVIGSPP